jgi:predicted CopG family antitoxin
MVRRTISLPASVDEKIRKIAEEEGSYSAAVARLVEDASKRTRSSERPSYIGSVDDPDLPRDFALNHEKYMKDALKRIGRRR